MNLAEIIEKMVSDISNAEDKVLNEAIQHCLTENNLKREEIILLTPRDRYNGKFYLIKKSDAVARVGEKEDLSKAYLLGGFRFNPETGERIFEK